MSTTEIESAWQREIEERVAAYDRGETETHAAEDVFAEARRIIAEASGFELRRATFDGQGLQPGVDGSWEDIRDLAYEDQGS